MGLAAERGGFSEFARSAAGGLGAGTCKVAPPPSPPFPPRARPVVRSTEQASLRACGYEPQFSACQARSQSAPAACEHRRAAPWWALERSAHLPCFLSAQRPTRRHWLHARTDRYRAPGLTGLVETVGFGNLVQESSRPIRRVFTLFGPRSKPQGSNVG